ncbi:hypothetical protein E1301_Tti020691 [Triplophysa tibetana]|uniref:Uncharacterized protein n=1 Tax=Triplophysa tibetana TaxID=1572043 RepID=A0A5A9N799_9TELE|nr:hypothetical protein E1301_Tti020691 [Triplophysa tibetana]
MPADERAGSTENTEPPGLPSTSGMAARQTRAPQTDHPSSKARKYRQEYINYGFTCIVIIQETISKLLTLSFKEDKTKEATRRSVKQAINEDCDTVHIEHFEKILPQLFGSNRTEMTHHPHHTLITPQSSMADEERDAHESLKQYILQRIYECVLHVLERQPLNIEYLHFVCRQEQVFINALSEIIHVSEDVMVALTNRINLIQSPMDMEESDVISSVDWLDSEYAEDPNLGVHVPVLDIALTDEEIAELQETVDPMVHSDSFGVDIFKADRYNMKGAVPSQMSTFIRYEFPVGTICLDYGFKKLILANFRHVDVSADKADMGKKKQQQRRSNLNELSFQKQPCWKNSNTFAKPSKEPSRFMRDHEVFRGTEYCGRGQKRRTKEQQCSLQTQNRIASRMASCRASGQERNRTHRPQPDLSLPLTCKDKQQTKSGT